MTDQQLARFEKNIDRQPNGCWLWTRAKVNGYGVMWISTKPTRHSLTHRLAYEHWVGPIPTGKEIDHLCRTRACANPAHLEPVSHLENVRRSPMAKASPIFQPRSAAHVEKVTSKIRGIKRSKATIEKLRALAVVRFTGRTMSAEARTRMSEARRLYWQRKRDAAMSA